MSSLQPNFNQEFLQTLDALFAWRRDVRHFRDRQVPDDMFELILAAMQKAPSVGLSQPWRVIALNDEAKREAVIANFEDCNREALNDYHGEKARLYAQLKLSGLKEAPRQIAVFTDVDTSTGSGLGVQTMPEMLCYSTVTAVMLLWLKASALGLGVGWVSILDPQKLCCDLDAPAGWKLTAYLCIGYPNDSSNLPELEKRGWEVRRSALNPSWQQFAFAARKTRPTVIRLTVKDG